MPRYTRTIFGLEIAFKTDADAERIDAAQALLEERMSEMGEQAGDLSKEKLLTFLALGLADDYLVLSSSQRHMEDRIRRFLEKCP